MSANHTIRPTTLPWQAPKGWSLPADHKITLQPGSHKTQPRSWINGEEFQESRGSPACAFGKGATATGTRSSRKLVNCKEFKGETRMVKALENIPYHEQFTDLHPYTLSKKRWQRVSVTVCGGTGHKNKYHGTLPSGRHGCRKTQRWKLKPEKVQISQGVNASLELFTEGTGVHCTAQEKNHENCKCFAFRKSTRYLKWDKCTQRLLACPSVFPQLIILISWLSSGSFPTFHT